jgi:acyl-CoA thioesterase-1
VENIDRIICFGDSITKGYAPYLQQYISDNFSEKKIEVINAGIGGETSKDGLLRIESIKKQRPGVVIIGFGMNDAFRGVGIDAEQFCKNLNEMIQEFEKSDIRVHIMTLHPVIGNDNRRKKLDKYNEIILKTCKESGVKAIDINWFWKTRFRNYKQGLNDEIHPGTLGNKLYAGTIFKIIRRPKIIIVWQYNGNPCECNYTCPYCQYPFMEQKGDCFFGTTEQWHTAFKKIFKNQELVFYFGHGEPTLGKEFYNVLEMIGTESKWEARMIINLSQPVERLLETKLAKYGRLNVNASFHPYQANITTFLKKLIKLRENGIEASVVYVMYPPLLKRFKEDFRIFIENDFVVHVRRFRGVYKGKYYPDAYNDTERRFIAQYCDDATIKYMLNEEPSFRKLTFTGMDFFILDNVGNVKFCDDFRRGQEILGNIFQNTINLFSHPIKFPAKNSSDGTVDGIANFLELDYTQMTGNNVLNFAKQGGVYKEKSGRIHYKNINIDFKDSKIRVDYDFPARHIKDLWYIVKKKKLIKYIKKQRFNYRNNLLIRKNQRKNRIVKKIKKYPYFYKFGRIIYHLLRKIK